MLKLKAPIHIFIYATQAPVLLQPKIRIHIEPAKTPSQTKLLEYLYTLTVYPIELDLSSTILSMALDMFELAMDQYIDEDRELKTLVNYGEDRQSVVLASRYSGLTRSKADLKFQMKLLHPVPNEVTIGDAVFLSREVASTVIDRARIRFAPAVDNSPYLRPKNTITTFDAMLGKNLRNITMKRLSVDSGSMGTLDEFNNIDFKDYVLRSWYSYDFNSAELNTDFSDYNNFVYYGSAAMRLSAFKEKIKRLENIQDQKQQFISEDYSGSVALAGRTYVQEQTAVLSKEYETIIRAMDSYEQYLYHTAYGIDSPYSASAFYVDGAVEYNSVGYWPKTSLNEPYSVNSSEATAWFENQLGIAQRFDEFNENSAVLTIPNFILEDEASAAYITFVSMIGHLFDNIKLYIDQYPYIYSRHINPNTELSKDLVADVAEAVGFTLPTLNSIYNLSDNVLGTQLESPRRDYTAETHKRLLHNLPFFAKAKGTRTALSTLLKTFGITPQLVDVRESGYPTSESVQLYDEFSYGLQFTPGEATELALLASSSRRNPRSIQFNSTFPTVGSQTVMSGDSKWALHATVHPENSRLGRIELVSGSAQSLILSSSYYEIFGNKALSISLRNFSTSATLRVIHVDNGDVLFDSSHSEPDSANVLVPLWNTTDTIIVGGSTPLSIGSYAGVIDDIRLWGINLSNAAVLNAALDPGSNAGDVYTDPVNHLHVYLSFNKLNASLLPQIENQSPYASKTTIFPNITTVGGVSITSSSFVRYSRTVRQHLATAGSDDYITNKIKVVPPPVFNLQSIDSNGVKTLSRTRSIVVPDQKQIQVGRNKVTIAVSPTRIVNQAIIRNLGLENINSIIGIPNQLYLPEGKSLEKLRKFYQQYYYVNVNINRYIRILSEVESVLDQIVDYFIPSKATLLKGIVIEPNILERTFIPPIKSLRFYGNNTRKTKSAKASLKTSRPDYSATFTVSDDIRVDDETTVSGKNQAHQAQLEDTEVLSLSATTRDLKADISMPTDTLSAKTNALKSEIVVDDDDAVHIAYNKFDATINEHESYNVLAALKSISAAISEERLGEFKLAYLVYDRQHGDPTKQTAVDTNIIETNKVPYNDVNQGARGAEPYNRIYARKLTSREIRFINNRPSRQKLLNTALYEIPPVADFRDVGVTTYFSSPSGIYYFPETVKRPAYREPVLFQSASTWQHGARYNQYDVVYQEVSTNDKAVLGNLIYNARAGNGRYYVFSTKPAYTPPADGTAYYSGSVPSYIPPSLDKNNWDLLRFVPVEQRLPKRVIFDTFTIPDPALNNFKVTTVSVDRIIDTPARYVDTFLLPVIPALGQVTGEMPIHNIAALFAVQSNLAGIRIRLYRTSAARDADLNRDSLTVPTGSHGVLIDFIVNQANVAENINAITTLVAGNNPPGGLIYYTVDDTENSSKAGINLQLFYFAIQIEPRVPRGHLKKHYRFYRDTSTGTRRRNYLGCKNTVDTTIDGAPPVQVFISEGNELIVSATKENNEINPGGGSTLNVT